MIDIELVWKAPSAGENSLIKKLLIRFFQTSLKIDLPTLRNISNHFATFIGNAHSTLLQQIYIVGA